MPFGILYDTFLDALLEGLPDSDRKERVCIDVCSNCGTSAVACQKSRQPTSGCRRCSAALPTKQTLILTRTIQNTSSAT